jgi:hypothetical protein
VSAKVRVRKVGVRKRAKVVGELNGTDLKRHIRVLGFDGRLMLDGTLHSVNFQFGLAPIVSVRNDDGTFSTANVDAACRVEYGTPATQAPQVAPRGAERPTRPGITLSEPPPSRRCGAVHPKDFFLKCALPNDGHIQHRNAFHVWSNG